MKKDRKGETARHGTAIPKGLEATRYGRCPTPRSIAASIVSAVESRAEEVVVAPRGPQGLSRRNIPPSSPPRRSRTRRESPASPPPPPPLLPFWQQNWFLGLLLLMSLSFFALALLLYLGLDVPEVSFSPASAAASEGVEVGSWIDRLFTPLLAIFYGSFMVLLW